MTTPNQRRSTILSPNRSILKSRTPRISSLGLDFGTDSTIQDAAFQSDGSLVIVGDFTSVNGVQRRGVAILDQNMNLKNNTYVPTFIDNSYDPPVDYWEDGALSIDRVLVGDDQKIYLFSRESFLLDEDDDYAYLCRLNSDGTFDSSFPINNPDLKFFGGEQAEKMGSSQFVTMDVIFNTLGETEYYLPGGNCVKVTPAGTIMIGNQGLRGQSYGLYLYNQFAQQINYKIEEFNASTEVRSIHYDPYTDMMILFGSFEYEGNDYSMVRVPYDFVGDKFVDPEFLIPSVVLEYDDYIPTYYSSQYNYYNEQNLVSGVHYLGEDLNLFYGLFTKVNGVKVNNMVVLDSSGSIVDVPRFKFEDIAFNKAYEAWSHDDGIKKVLARPDGKLLAMGSFHIFDGRLRYGLAEIY